MGSGHHEEQQQTGGCEGNICLTTCELGWEDKPNCNKLGLHARQDQARTRSIEVLGKGTELSERMVHEH